MFSDRYSIEIALVLVFATLFTLSAAGSVEFSSSTTVTPSDGEDNGKFGFSVSITGSYLFIGAPGAEKVYASVHSSGSWGTAASVTGGGDSGDLGYDVDVAASGYAVAGRPYFSGEEGKVNFYKLSSSGHSYLYGRQASDDTTYETYGYTVAMLTNNDALIGKPDDAWDYYSQGSVYHYEKDSDDEWHSESNAWLDSPEDAFYGWSVSCDRYSGTNCAIGAPGWGKLFRWTTSSPESSYELDIGKAGIGHSTAIDLTWIAAGTTSGKVYMYHYASSSWSRTTTLNPSISGFGKSLALAANYMAVGAPDSNAVYLYHVSGTLWTVTTSWTGAGSFGYDVSIWADGTGMGHIAIGAPYDNSNKGAVYVKTFVVGAGYAGSLRGSISVCNNGKYQPNTAQSTCLVCDAGYYVPASGARTAQIQCPAGTYSNGGVASCTQCPAGYYSSAGATSSAACIQATAGHKTNSDQSGQEDCPAGTYSEAGASTCIKCNNGKYQPNSVQSTCLDATPGHFVPDDGDAHIAQEDCPAGTYSGALAAVCIKCNDGKYQPDPAQASCDTADAGYYVPADGDAHTTQLVCDNGHYQPATGKATCVEADAGHFVIDDNQPHTTQDDCATGKWSVDGASGCTTATAGYKTKGDQSGQEPCPAGTFSNAGASSCTNCFNGEYSNSAASPSCTTSSVGHYVENVDTPHTAQEPCDAGKYAGTGQSSCTQATAGHKTNSDQSGQEDCPAGTYSEAGASTCIKCNNGKYQPNSVQSTCLDATPGHFVPDDGDAHIAQEDCPAGTYSGALAAVCIKCNDGKYQPDPAQASCDTADAGYYVPADGDAHTTQLVCDNGHYQPATGKATCVEADAGHFVIDDNQPHTTQDDCATGKWSVDGASGCTTATAGYKTKGDQSGQEPCPAGTFSNAGASSCTNCFNGEYSNSAASPSCTTSSVGHYVENVDTPHTAQEPCDAGKYAGTGQSSCTQATAGHKTNSDQSGQEDCPAGTYSEAGASTCIKCNNGKYQPNSVQSTCLDATPGHFVPDDGDAHIAQEDCTAGTYSGALAAVCIKCNDGKYQPDPAQASCDTADAGYYVPADGDAHTTQLVCDNGHYQPATGKATCVEADAGHFVIDDNQPHTTQDDCATGKWSVDGASGCTTATAGYKTKGDQSGQEPCPAGTFSNAGASSCTNCFNGEYSNSAASPSCTTSSVGHYVENVDTPHTAQEPCDAGKYAGTGQSSCTQATAGHKTNSDQSGQEDCPAGTYSEAGASTCIKCNNGKYQPNSVQSTCLDATPGHFVPDDGDAHIAQEDCPAGTYSGALAAVCIKCNDGKYQPDPAQASCDTADAGYYVPADGDAHTTQLVCDNGHYQPATGKATCVEADAGHFVIDDNQPHTTQDDCATGKWSVDGASGCTTATAGYKTKGDQSGQEPCPAGTFSNAGASSCTNCFNGEYSNSAASPSCTTSSVGHYVENVDTPHTAQEPCDAGKYAGTGQSSCTQATAGHKTNSDQSGQEDCPAGTYSEAGASTCIKCNNGKYQPNSVQSTCLDATPGHFVPDDGDAHIAQEDCTAGTYSGALAAVCIKCNDGKYQPDPAQASCDTADAGYYVPADGDAHTTQLVCDNGHYQPATGKATCVEADAGHFVIDDNQPHTTQDDCATGKWSVDGASGCTTATAGYKTKGDQSGQEPCPAGTFSNAGASSCTNCFNGEYSNSAASPSCTTSSVGHYVENVDTPHTAQEPCDAGKYAGTGQSSCTQATAGHKTNSDQSGQEDCPAGTYSEAGASTCIKCNNGKYQPNSVQSTCLDATPGHFVPDDGDAHIAQEDCPAGTYSGALAAVCIKCNDGKYQPDPAQASCDTADAGYYVPADGDAHTTQLVCDNGHYQPATGKATCVEADAGHFVIDDNQPHTTQDDCATGKWSVDGASGCTTATAGYKTKGDQSGQEPCPAGTFSNAGASSCTNCFNGEYSNSAASPSCTTSSVGHYVENVDTPHTAQEPCDAGKYAGTGQSSCTQATAGHKTNSDQSGQEDCPAGTYSEAGASTCIKCNNGKYQPNSVQSTCLDATPGHFVPDDGDAHIAQEDCPAGTYSGALAAVCIKCNDGKYQPDPAQASCDTADAGYYVPADGDAHTTQLVCDNGHYQPATGKATCVEADAGHFVIDDNQPHTTQDDCATGKWSVDGASGCTTATAGYKTKGRPIRSGAMPSRHLLERGRFVLHELLQRRVQQFCRIAVMHDVERGSLRRERRHAAHRAGAVRRRQVCRHRPVQLHPGDGGPQDEQRPVRPGGLPRRHILGGRRVYLHQVQQRQVPTRPRAGLVRHRRRRLLRPGRRRRAHDPARLRQRPLPACHRQGHLRRGRRRPLRY
ncbi:putative protein serine/threonine kinase [Carpediemonas membranifera]|uniref:TNFR-Cys domain-containing protein n=1 Tax=Carpediemonas membranifera TaxID=201153 RepID=A0A8J6E4P3_9EUKA|nr:putative protein serine/threonine kinase [Carpediemonas membranifera]|eukprot:KAG9397448.1 putative protein serine/threonine kinase [Carpediemonas membranifera]